MKKTSFHVFEALPWVMMFIVVVSSIAYIWLTILMLDTFDDISNLILMIVGLTLFFVVLPIFLLIRAIIIYWTNIKITKDGIESIRFGKRLVYLSWEEIHEIRKVYGNWMFFSKESLWGYSFKQAKKRKDVIYMTGNFAADARITRYAPKHLIENSDYFQKKYG